MNNTVQKILNGQNISREEAFDLVNDYPSSDLWLSSSDNHALIHMGVNKYEGNTKSHIFRKAADNETFSVQASDIVDTRVTSPQDTDSVMIQTKLQNGLKFLITVYNINNGCCAAMPA